MPQQQNPNASQLCVVINPPDDLLERAAKHNVDIDAVIVRFTRPRKIIARLPVQLLDGCEIVDDLQIIEEEINAALESFGQ